MFVFYWTDDFESIRFMVTFGAPSERPENVRKPSLHSESLTNVVRHRQTSFNRLPGRWTVSPKLLPIDVC